MVIGHNPAVQSLVIKLARNANGNGIGCPDPELEEISRKFPNRCAGDARVLLRLVRAHPGMR